MSPTIVMRDGRPWLTVGTPGGSTIITTVLQLLIDRIDGQMHAAAGDRRTAHRAAQHRGDAGRAGVPRDARGRRAAGARPRFVTVPEIGAANGIEFLPGGGVLAAAEPVRRGGGSAMVEQPSD